jgi:hypothetical protein
MNITLLILNAMAFIGTIAWSIAEPSYEPIIAAFLTGAGLVGQGFAKRKKTIRPVPTKSEVDEIEEENNNRTNESENIEEPDGAVKVNIFPESTVFFHDRFCSAFPGVRGIKWFENTDEAIQRLSKLLAKPLVVINEDGTSSFHPIWWWRYGNMYIEKFERLDNDTVLLDCYELKIDKIAAVNEGSYYQCFVYIQTKPMEPTGLNQRDPDDIEQSVKAFGYCKEEYGLFRGKYKVTREEYDDAAAMVEGQLTDFNGEAELRVRYITPYNIIIAAVNSPVNNNQFDSELRKLMDGILQGTYLIEDLAKAIQVLPKREKRG